MAEPTLERPRSAAGQPPTCDVIAFVASAGGLEALGVVLRALPEDLPAAVVVGMHLGGRGSRLVELLARHAALPVRWAADGMGLPPGEILVCPPKSQLEVLPDRSCRVSPCGEGMREPSLDGLLESLADSVGSGTVAAVLTGMGKDGALGAAALHEAGGIVLVQSEDSAEHASMPRAVIEAGAADLVLPLYEIAPVVLDAVRGRELPRPREEREAALALFAGGGEIAAIGRDVDWSKTPFGAVGGWAPELRSTMRLALASPQAMFLLWGDELLMLYNDAYRDLIGTKHPMAFGRPTVEVWPEVWHLNAPIYERVLAGESTRIENAPYPLIRRGVLEDTWFDISFVPIRDEGEEVRGLLGMAVEKTAEILAARRLSTLRALGDQATGARSRTDALEIAARVLAGDGDDLIFVAAYLLDVSGRRAQLVSAQGIETGGPVAPRAMTLRNEAAWPLARALADGQPLMVDDVASRFPGMRVQGTEPQAAVVMPLRDHADERFVGALVLGVNPRLPFDERYREYLGAVGAAVESSLAEAHARERERTRLERLQELDRAKTEFFSNVSHEFRTPLTLMIAPLEEMLRRAHELPPGIEQEAELILRNTSRLLRLVDTLLDFSQAEAGRLRANFLPTDLARWTADIAALFRGAAEQAGVELRVDVESLPEPVWVDVEMWEKIVSNLISNALKFTFMGTIEVTLRALPKHAELVVRDTGVGIEQEDLPLIFKRFHRVHGARARTHEGTGIGLALVKELVGRHHGQVRATSTPGEGSTFTVWIPFGLHAPRAGTASPERPPSTTLAAAMAAEAARWSVDGAGPQATEASRPADDVLSNRLSLYAPGARVLVVDDNRDMRDYLSRLLGTNWTVVTAQNGEEALASARDDAPDLVVADVMMPRLDGFGLLKALRDDPRLRAVPVVLVTARAGEESAVEGLLAGADDYIVKPFSARELVARVGGQLELARTRRRATELNAFRIGLSDALRALSDPLEIQRTACRMLLEQIGADRARFVEIDVAAGEFITMGGHSVDGMPGGYGRYPIAAYAPLGEAILAGRRLAIEDTQADPYVHDIRDALAELQIGAQLVLPLARDGGSTVALAIHHRTARAWTTEEIAIAVEAAGRAWAEVERARAETALRESEQRLRTLAANPRPKSK